jgi:hypothetical protein
MDINVLRHSSYEGLWNIGFRINYSKNDASVAQDCVIFVHLMVYYLVDPESVSYKCYALMWCTSAFYF